MEKSRYVMILVATFLISLKGTGLTQPCPFGLCGNKAERVDYGNSETGRGGPGLEVPDFGEEIRDALSEFKSAVTEVRETQGLTVFVPFTKKVWPANTPVSKILEENGLVGFFEPPDLAKRLTLRSQEVFSSLADLAVYLERTYKLFTRFRDGNVYISVYTKKTYNVDFAEGYLSKKTIQALLRGDLAYANYFPETGKLVVYDDYEGHLAVSKYLKDLAQRIRRVYTYEILVRHKDAGARDFQKVYRGEIVAGRSSPLGDIGFVRVFPGDTRTMVHITFPEFPARTYTFLMRREGGEWKAQDGKWLFRVKLKLKGTKLCSKWEIIEEF